MGPTENWPAAVAAETVELDELLHAVPRLLRLLLKLFLDTAHLRPDRPVHLRHDAVGAARGAAAVLRDRALSRVATDTRDTQGLTLALAQLASDAVTALAQLAHHPVAGDGATPLKATYVTPHATSSRSALVRLVQGWIAPTTRSRTSRAAPTGPARAVPTRPRP